VIRPEFGAPRIGFTRKEADQRLTASLRFASAFELHAQAIVGDNGDQIGTGLGALPSPHRFEQAGEQGRQAEELERGAA